jgi:hypothetical protein
MSKLAGASVALGLFTLAGTVMGWCFAIGLVAGLLFVRRK